MSDLPPYFACWKGIPEDAAAHLKEKLSSFYIFKEPRYYMLSPAQAEKWVGEGKIAAPYRQRWVPEGQPMFEGYALVVQLEHSAVTDSGIGIFVTTHQRILDMVEAFLFAWGLQQKRIEELTPKPKVKVEKPYFRTCQECGYTQKDVDPESLTFEEVETVYRERKCRNCKSSGSLDFGSRSDPRRPRAAVSDEVEYLEDS